MPDLLFPFLTRQMLSSIPSQLPILLSPRAIILATTTFFDPSPLADSIFRFAELNVLQNLLTSQFAHSPSSHNHVRQKSRLCSPPTSCSPTSQRDDPSLPIRSPDIKSQTTACDRGRVTSAIPSFATRDKLSIRGPDFAPPASSRTLHSLTKPKAPNQHVRLCKGPGG